MALSAAHDGLDAGDQLGLVERLGQVIIGAFAEMLGGYGEEVRDPSEIAAALQRARESVLSNQKSAVINIWVDPDQYAPGTKAQTMYK
jgi:acetolactate synthase-1/2/3 large subunit